jgi:hypothetical protein
MYEERFFPFASVTLLLHAGPHPTAKLPWAKKRA